MSLSLLNKEFLEESKEVAFRRLFVEYYPSLLNFARRYVEGMSVAEDLVQDVFVKIWETQDQLTEIEDFSAYVYQMVRFKCFNYLRNEKVRGNATRSYTAELDVTEINAYIKEETLRMVGKALEELPPACRKVFTLTLEGYRAKDIADQLQIAVETVKKQKQIARKMLKKKLGRYFFLLFCLGFPQIM